VPNLDLRGSGGPLLVDDPHYPQVSSSSDAIPVFRPETYGAKRDGIADDTAAVKACVQACVDSGIANGSYCGIVQFNAVGLYQFTGALTQGGATKGNALIPLPVIPDTGQKFILVLKGFEDQGIFWHWNQTVEQKAGVVLRTNVVGTNDATYGRASVIGGPTPQQGYGQASNVWSNMMIVVDGVQVTTPNDPRICGFDFRGVGEMNFKNGSALTTATPATQTAATQAWQFGLATPETNNNALSRIGKYTCEGHNYGLMAGEHLQAESVNCVYTVAGVEFGTSTANSAHGIHINKLLVEASQVGIGSVEGGIPIKIRIDEFSWENIGFAVINDPSNFLFGEVYTSGIAASNLLVDSPAGGVNYAVRGAANLSVYDMGRQKGVQTAPGVPATTVTLRNPFFRDALVQITGGTVTDISVTDSGGTAKTWATNTTSPVYVLLSTGGYITMTYSVAPAWKWMIT
jgi:hypothetical protein